MTPKKKPEDLIKERRPTLYKEEYCEAVFKLCLLGATNEEMANFFNVSNETIKRWKKKYPKFSSAIKEGKEDADSNVAKSLYNTAMDGNTTAQIFWLKNRNPTRWRDKQEIDVSGEVSVFKLKKMKP